MRTARYLQQRNEQCSANRSWPIFRKFPRESASRGDGPCTVSRREARKLLGLVIALPGFGVPPTLGAAWPRTVDVGLQQALDDRCRFVRDHHPSTRPNDTIAPREGARGKQGDGESPQFWLVTKLAEDSERFHRQGLGIRLAQPMRGVIEIEQCVAAGLEFFLHHRCLEPTILQFVPLSRIRRST